jgi:hypothetical protein
VRLGVVVCVLVHVSVLASHSRWALSFVFQ